MKRKVLASVLSLVLVASLLTACTDKEEGKETNKEVTENKETEESTEESEEESTEESEEESTEESSEESTEESTEESGEESTEESEEESPEETKEPVAAGNDEDWSTAYDSFFENYELDQNKIYMEMTMPIDELGVMNVVISVYDNDTMVSMGMGGAADNGFAMYAMSDGYTYVSTSVNGEVQWAKGKMDAEEVGSLADTDSVKDSLAADTTYVEAVEEDGIVYDVLSANVDGEELLYYINRASQKLERITGMVDGVEAVIELREPKEIILPEEALNTEELSEEEFAGVVFGAMMTIMAGGM